MAEVLRRTGRVRLSWGDSDHFEAGVHRPCRLCSTVTQMRDARGAPCHLNCAERELAQVIWAERFGDISGLDQELTGIPLSAVADEGMPSMPEVRR